MSPPTVLLIQARETGDAMLEHERRCIRRRLEGRPLRLVTRNAVTSRADQDWLTGIELVVVGGSGAYSVHHPLSRPWIEPLHALLGLVLERGIPGFGLCFGHQLLGAHLGATVVTDLRREEAGTIEVRLTDAGRTSGLFSPLGDLFLAHTGHTDYVVDVPSGVDLLAEGSEVITQAFHLRGTRFYSTQFHPELDTDEARERYLACRTDEDGTLAESHRKAVERFVDDPRTSTQLLGRFLDLASNTTGHVED